jgi:hypothetical protein
MKNIEIAQRFNAVRTRFFVVAFTCARYRPGIQARFRTLLSKMIGISREVESGSFA